MANREWEEENREREEENKKISVFQIFPFFFPVQKAEKQFFKKREDG